ncbi:unnamed protein product [Prunus armeniaca]
MMTCNILHNMIVNDEYDYNATDMYEPDPMNTALTRIYERLKGPSGEPLEQEPLRCNQSYIHERRQVDLMEHLWEVKGNDGE